MCPRHRPVNVHASLLPLGSGRSGCAGTTAPAARMKPVIKTSEKKLGGCTLSKPCHVISRQLLARRSSIRHRVFGRHRRLEDQLVKVLRSHLRIAPEMAGQPATEGALLMLHLPPHASSP